MPSNATWTAGLTPSNPYQGHIDSGQQGVDIVYGIANFVGAETTVLIPCRSGVKKFRLVIVVYAEAAANVLSWVDNGDGTITVTRTDTTANGRFSVLQFF